MRRIAGAMVCGLACLILPASASAAITTNDDPLALANTLGAPPGAVTGAGFIERPAPAAGTPHGISDAQLGGFPATGAPFAILTTGNAAAADGGAIADVDLGVGPTHGFGGAPGNAYDTSVMSISLTAPAAINCMSFDFRFLSEDFSNQFFNDGFLAMLDQAEGYVDPTGDIAAPTNFAFDETGKLASARGSLTTANATGTGYSGATQILSARTAVAPGPHTLYLAVFDVGDRIVDSGVFVDNLQFFQAAPGSCAPAIDRVDPTVSLDPVPAGGTPSQGVLLSGDAGDAATDSDAVTVQIYPAGSAVPVRVVPVLRQGSASWQLPAFGLPPGNYSVHAHQTDAAGNLGVSQTRTFTVSADDTTPEPTPTSPPPPQQVGGQTAQTPVPVLGQTVVAGKVGSGSVKIRLKNGKFRTLGANEAIPLGSEVDATKGRVRLTSASGPGGAVQTADFYKGAFIVTQTKGAKPITQLKLSGKLACAKRGKATSSAKKKVRRLWGDGKGRFRTRGRHGAATVRGTKWLTEDRCDSTKISVKQGTVVVRDFAKKKNKVVKKGQSYVARAKKKK